MLENGARKASLVQKRTICQKNSKENLNEHPACFKFKDEK